VRVLLVDLLDGLVLLLDLDDNALELLLLGEDLHVLLDLVLVLFLQVLDCPGDQGFVDF